MFQEVARHWELIFFLLNSPTCYLGEFGKETSLWTYFRLLEHRKMRIGCRKIDVSRVIWLFQL